MRSTAIGQLWIDCGPCQIITSTLASNEPGYGPAST